MDWADTTTYLGDIMQSNLKLDQHMALMVDEALKNFGEINHIIKQATQKASYWLSLACVAQYWSTLTLCGTQH